MEDLKQAKKVFSRLGWSYIAGTVGVYLLQIFVVLVLFKIKPEWQTNLNINLGISCLITYGIAMPLIVLIAGSIPVQVPEKKKMKWWQFLLALIICYSMVYISNFIGLIITGIIGIFKGSPVQNELLETVTSSNLWVNFLAMVVLAPIVEEFVFRKVIVDRTRQYGEGMAVATSAIMFGLFHGNLNQFAYAVVLGAFFSFLYLKTGKLKITIALHAIVNFFGGIIAPSLLKLLDFDTLQNLDTNNQEILMEYITDNLAGWIVFFAYVAFLLGVVIAGFVLFIVFFKRFKLEAGPNDVPKGKRFQVLFLNPGMLTFCVIWLVLIVLQLLM